MNVTNAVLVCLGLVVVMWLLYAVGIQYLRGGVWRVLLPVALAAVILDVLLNYSLFALVTFDWPRRGELTFSQKLHRLSTYACWRGVLARGTAKYLLDWPAPGGQHIYPRST